MPTKKSKKKERPLVPTVLGPAVGFTDLLDYAIEKKQKENREKVKTGEIKRFPLRPSAAGMCSRQLALELMEYRGLAFFEDTPLLEPQIYRLFELGHSIEWRSLQTFRLLKISQRYKQQVVGLFDIESETHKKELIEGSCDVVFWSDKYKGLGDVKSKKDGWSNHYRSRWAEELEKFAKMKSLVKLSPTAFYADDLQAFIKELNRDFLVDNLYQVNLYACSDFMRKRGIEFAFLYRYNKNSSEHMEIRFRPDQSVAADTRLKFNTISQTVDEKKVDDMVCDFPVGSMRHAFCNCHKIKSYADHDPLKMWYRSLPKKVWPKDIDDILDIKRRELKKLFNDFTSGTELVKAEKQIVEIMLEMKQPKIRLTNGHVYEIKYLKSPRPHYELRRGK